MQRLSLIPNHVKEEKEIGFAAEESNELNTFKVIPI